MGCTASSGKKKDVLCSSATLPGLLFTRVRKTGRHSLTVCLLKDVKRQLDKFCSVVGLFFVKFNLQYCILCVTLVCPI